MSVYIANFLKICLIMISLQHRITATIEANVSDIIHGDLEIHTVLLYHCATYSVWPGSVPVVLHMVFTAETLDTHALRNTSLSVKYIFYIMSL